MASDNPEAPNHNQSFSRRRHAMVCFVHQRIGVQSRVCHDSVDEVVHHGGDAVDAAKSVVERELFCLGHDKSSYAQFSY
jgi:hypothetical protein